VLRSGQYEIKEADGLSRGTKIVIHLKPEHREYADEARIRTLIQKYSNFINCPIFVNNERCNTVQVSCQIDQLSDLHWE
jgi:TNF receptor-associated protein 1